MLEYARFQSSRLNVDLGRESRGFFALGSSLGMSSSSSSSTSFFFGFSAFGAGAAAGFGSFFSFGGGVKVSAFSTYCVSPKMGFREG